MQIYIYYSVFLLVNFDFTKFFDFYTINAAIEAVTFVQKLCFKSKDYRIKKPKKLFFILNFYGVSTNT